MGEQSGAAKVGAWLAGIAATVISGYLIWYFTVPRPPAVTTFEGMVYSGDSPVAKAKVSLKLTGTPGADGPIVDFTDDNGAYKFELSGLPEKTAGTLAADAEGYEPIKPRRLPLPLQPDIRLDIPLTRLAAAAVPTPGPVPAPGGGGGGEKQIAPGLVHLPAYVPKTAIMAKQVRIGQ